MRSVLLSGTILGLLIGGSRALAGEDRAASDPIAGALAEARQRFLQGQVEAGQAAIARAVEQGTAQPSETRGRVWMQVGLCLCESGRFAEGAEFFRRSALDWGGERGDQYRADALASLAEAYMAQGDYERALAAYPLAIDAINSPMSVELEDRRARSQNPITPGQTTRIPQVRMQQIGNQQIPIITYLEVPGAPGHAYSVKDNPLKAFHMANRQRFEGECRRRMAEACAELGQFRLAAQETRAAVQIYGQLNDPFERARSLLLLAALERSSGQYAAAAEHREQAQQLFRDVRLLQGPDLEPGAVSIVTQTFSYPPGHERPAPGELRQKTETTMSYSGEAPPSEPGKASAPVRNPTRANPGVEAFWASSRARIRSVEAYRGAKGKDYYLVKFERPVDPWQGEADAAAEGAALALERNQPAEAFAQAATAGRLHRAIGDTVALINDLGIACLARLRMDEPPAARRLADEQLRLAEQSGRTDLLWRAQLNLARCQRRAGQAAEAQALLRQASQAVEQLRAAVQQDTLRIGLFERRVAVYDEFLALLLETPAADGVSGRDIEAFDAAEKARARVLLEALRGVRGGPSLAGRSRQALLSDRRRIQVQTLDLQRQIRAAAAKPGDAKPPPPAELEGQLATLRTELADLDRNLLAPFQAPSAAASIQPLGYAELRRQRVIAPGTALLVYWLGAEKSCLWVVDAEQLRMVLLPPRREIAARAEPVVAALARFPEAPADCPVEAFVRDSHALYQTILAPAAPWLKGLRTLVVIPDGPLNSIPWAALAVTSSAAPEAGGAEYLADRYRLVRAPSATVFLELARRHTSPPDAVPQRIAIFADPVAATAERADEQAAAPGLAPPDPAVHPAGLPPLPPLRMSRQEAARIADSFAGRADVFLGAAATKAAAQRCLTSGYRFVHFGTHGLLNLQDPELSGVLLSPGASPGDTGILRLGELAAWQVTARLISLSACETGLGAERRGEGVMAFQHQLLAAGAANVVVSLWKVEDASSAALMSGFYAQLASGAGDVAGSLRTAQIELRDHAEERFDPAAAAAAVKRGETPVKVRVRPYQHPYYWAAFVLAGAGS